MPALKHRRPGMRSTVRVGLVAGLLAGAACAVAGEVRVTHARCAAEVQVAARDAPLSAVLKKLATVLDFELRFDSQSDPLVTLDATERAELLPARLGSSQNVTTLLERDPRCPGEQRIVKVWVLPGSAARTSVAALRQSEEQALRAKEGADMILRAHGMDADGQPLPQ
jgi:hypothetical protein